MKLSDVYDHIGANVSLNGKGDLAFDGTCRRYIHPAPFTFTIVKVTRGGRVHIQCNNKTFLTVNAVNIDLEENQ